MPGPQTRTPREGAPPAYTAWADYGDGRAVRGFGQIADTRMAVEESDRGRFAGKMFITVFRNGGMLVCANVYIPRRELEPRVLRLLRVCGWHVAPGAHDPQLRLQPLQNTEMWSLNPGDV